MLGKIFGKNKLPADSELTIDDLITLERYDEAEQRLVKKVRSSSRDLRSNLRLAEVYVAQKKVEKAVDEYLHVSKRYAADGFYDKGIALLSKVAKIAPGNDRVPQSIEALRTMKRLEHRRHLVLSGIKANPSPEAGSAALLVDLMWKKLVQTRLVQHLEEGQLQKLFSVLETLRLASGETLARRGESGDWMCLVIDSKLGAFAEVNGKESELRTFEPGSLVGDSVLLRHQAWPADYRVIEGGTLLKLTRSGLQQAMTGSDNPRTLLEILGHEQNDHKVAQAVRHLEA